MIIDFHTHIFSPGLVKNPSEYFDDDTFSLLYSDEKSKVIDHNDLIKAMDVSNIDYAVAMGFPWKNPKYCDEQNEYLSSVMSSTNNRIISYGSLQLGNQDTIEDQVKHIRDLGLAGIGEVAFYGDGLNDSKSDILNALCSSAMRHSLPVCIHINEPVGHNYTGKHQTDLHTVYSVLQNYRDLTVILAHWGGGLLFYELMKEVKNSLLNVYYDTAASPYLYSDEIYNTAINIIGPEKILFGSDFPLINFSRYIDSIKINIASGRDWEKILGKNAWKILKGYMV